MIVKLTKIGSSQGIILNKDLLRGLGENVTHLELEVKGREILVKPHVDPHSVFAEYIASHPVNVNDEGLALPTQDFLFDSSDEGF